VRARLREGPSCCESGVGVEGEGEGEGSEREEGSTNDDEGDMSLHTMMSRNVGEYVEGSEGTDLSCMEARYCGCRTTTWRFARRMGITWHWQQT
jgi:hypothetical protein